MLGTFSESTQPIKCCVLNSIRIRLQLTFFFFSPIGRTLFVLSCRMIYIYSLIWTIPEPLVRPWDGQTAIPLGNPRRPYNADACRLLKK